MMPTGDLTTWITRAMVWIATCAAAGTTAFEEACRAHGQPSEAMQERFTRMAEDAALVGRMFTDDGRK